MRELFPTPATLADPPEQVAPGPDRPGWEQIDIEKRPETLNEILHKLYFETVNKRLELSASSPEGASRTRCCSARDRRPSGFLRKTIRGGGVRFARKAAV